jgi:putative SOS response-associated peptidase YedK
MSRDSFYEWRKEGKRKVPMRFKLKSGEPFTFAGLWDSWRQPDGNLLRTYTIVTTEPNDLLRPIHNRMPVMLSNNDALKWFAIDGEIAHALSLLRPYPRGEMEGYDVLTLVNDPRNDSPECIRPIEGLNRDDGTIQRLLDFR